MDIMGPVTSDGGERKQAVNGRMNLSKGYQTIKDCYCRLGIGAQALGIIWTGNLPYAPLWSKCSRGLKKKLEEDEGFT
jgi:hypothetical protein